DRRRDGGVLRARVLRLSGTANEPPEKAISAAAGSGADERTSREAFRGARGGPGGGTRGRAGAAVGVRAGGTLPPSLQVSPREPATKMQLPPEPVAVQRLPAAYQLPRQECAGANSHPQDRSVTHRISLQLRANRRLPPPVRRHRSVASLRPGGQRYPPEPQPAAITGWNSFPYSSRHAEGISRCSAASARNSVRASCAR